MLIICGRRYAGKVDRVPGLFFVKTYFTHVYGLPCLPLASFLLWEGPQKPLRGVQIHFCWRSILKGWLWWYPLWVFFAMALFLSAGPNLANPRPQDIMLRRLIGLVILGMIIGIPIVASWMLSRIRPKRAHELAAYLSISTFVLEQHLQGNQKPLQDWLETQPADAFPDQTTPRLETGIQELRNVAPFKSDAGEITVHRHNWLEPGAVALEKSPTLIFGVPLRVWLEFIACGLALVWPMVLTAWGVGFEGNADSYSLPTQLLILAATACVGAAVIWVLIYCINAPTDDKTVRTLSIIGVAVCLGIFGLGSAAQILTMLIMGLPAD